MASSGFFYWVTKVMELIAAISELFKSPQPSPVPPQPSPKPEPGPELPDDDWGSLPPVVMPPTTPGINELRQELLVLHNAYRADNNANPLWLHTELNEIAQRQAEYQAGINGWSNLHGRPQGHSLASDVAEVHIAYSTYGENAAAGHTSPQTVVEGWKKSPGHARNMRQGSYKYVGFGYAESTKGVRYWISIFVG